CRSNVFSFFFQAEDGIRDRNVTGVQTCALPIYFPVKAIDLIDEAAARARLNKSLGYPVIEDADGTPIVSREDIEAVVNSWGGVRSEERRVGKEGRDRGGTEQGKKEYSAEQQEVK